MIRKNKLNFVIYVFGLIVLFFLIEKVHAGDIIVENKALTNLKIYETKKDFKNSEFQNCLRKNNGTIVIKDIKEGEFNKGSIISKSISSEFPMTELIPSWNIDVQTSTSFAVYFQVSKDEQNWTDWLYIGRDGKIPDDIVKIRENDGVIVDVDYLIFTKPYKYFRYRIDFYSQKKSASIKLKLFAVCCGNSKVNDELYDEFKKFAYNKNQNKKNGGWIKKLNVPYRSQLAVNSKFAYAVCCPTSIAMVLEYYGINYPTEKVCETAFDEEYRLWGSWWRASQTFSKFGLRSYVTQLRDFDEIKQYIAKDIPIVISIKAFTGELSSSPYQESPGHILVIIGLDEDEKVWVNDPYNIDNHNGSRKWTKKEIEDVLIKKGGVVIIAEKR